MSEFPAKSILAIRTSKGGFIDVHEIDKGDCSFREIEQIGEYSKIATAQNLRDIIRDSGWTRLENAAFIVPVEAREGFEKQFKGLVIRLYECAPSTDPFGIRRSPTSWFRVIDPLGVVAWNTASASPRPAQYESEKLVSGGRRVALR